MALALGIGGLIKGATGMGLPIMALPILAAFLGVQHAVAVMCLPIVLTNAWQCWSFRDGMREADFLTGLLLGGAVGIAIGTWFIVSVPERALSLSLALLVLGYVGLRLASPDFTLPRPLGRRLAPAFGFGGGFLQGATGIGSPIGVTFIHALRLSRRGHVFAVAMMLCLFTIVQIPALAFAGIMSVQIAVEGIVAMLPAFAAMPLGNWLAGRISQKAFDRVVLGLLCFIALQLLWKSLGG